MKRSITLLLSVLMLFSFAACKGKNTTQTEPLSSAFATSAFASQSASSAAASTTASTTAVSKAASTTAESTTAESTAASTTAEKTTEKKAETQKAEPETAESAPVCFVTIDCRNIKNNLSSLKKEKKAFVPQSGYILKDARVPFEEGESAFDALKRACKENVCTDNCEYCQKGGIQLEFSFTPAYKSYYVEGIHQLYEKDCGSFSGWMFSVNGEFSDVSSSEYLLKAGDKVTFAYTVSMGDDLTEAF
ncbi:MAG: DUF4430 domain-containing protein [Clostridiaceae bacterium]|nr:DUF4430 domain-containing protein [Clostridiaceae bacterium]